MSSLSHRATLAALIIITLTVALAWPVEAQPTPADLKSVLVRGEGVVVTTPDIATLNIGAAVRRETPAEASGRAEALAEALMRLLLDHGVERRDIQTTSVSLQPQFATRAPGESEQRIVA